MTHVHAGCKAGVGLRTKESPMGSASSGACKGPAAVIGRAVGIAVRAMKSATPGSVHTRNNYNGLIL